MGTNFYAKGRNCLVCRESEGIHIGKLSVGWKFLFQNETVDKWDEQNNYIPGNKFKTIQEFKDWLKPLSIIDEYGDEISQEKFWGLVELQQNEKGHGEMLIDGYDFTCSVFS